MKKPEEIRAERDKKYTGEIIIAVTNIEVSIDNIISKYFCDDEEKRDEFSEIVLGTMTIGPKLRLMISLGLHNQSKFRGKYKYLQKDIESIMSLRNVVAHGHNIATGKTVKLKDARGKTYTIDKKYMTEFRKRSDEIERHLTNILRKADF